MKTKPASMSCAAAGQIEMNFDRQPTKNAWLQLTFLILVIGASGCATSPTVGLSAPRSNVTRQNALALARHVATTIGGQVYAVAPTGSMLPVLDEGSIVTVEKVSFDRLRAGDIIIYRDSAGKAVIHRLYEHHGDRWFVLGDNNTSIDPESLSRENFLGRVCAIFYTSSSGPAFSQKGSDSPATAIASAH